MFQVAAGLLMCVGLVVADPGRWDSGLSHGGGWDGGLSYGGGWDSGISLGGWDAPAWPSAHLSHGVVKAVTIQKEVRLQDMLLYGVYSM